MQKHFSRIALAISLLIPFAIFACQLSNQDFVSPPIGTPQVTLTSAESTTSLSICSFNIQFLGNSNKRQNEALANVVETCDIVAVQELVSPPYDGVFPDGTSFRPDNESAAFFDEMKENGYLYVISEEDTGTSDKIHRNGSTTEWWVSFYRPDKVERALDLPFGFLADDRSNHDDYERVPYAFSFRAKGGGADFVLISVHLKPGASEKSKARRKHELKSIANWIDDNDSIEHDFIILGDMNIEDYYELQDATPDGFISLNDKCAATNTSIRSPKPYDHAMYRPAYSEEDIDLSYGFKVVSLVEEMRDSWSRPDPYPGDPYIHNSFRQYYSDHNPTSFKIMVKADDD